MAKRISFARPEPLHEPTSRRIQLVFIGIFVVGNLLVPLVVGEIYPFTVSPMFCDQPEHYCVFTVTDDDGNILDSANYGLQMEYDGNPPGLGVGIKPPDTINQFGEIPNEQQIRRQVEKYLRARNRQSVNVELKVIGAIDSQHVGEIRSETYRITLKP